MWICSTRCVWRSHGLCQSRQCPFVGSWTAIWRFGRFWCLPDITKPPKYLGVFSYIRNLGCSHGEKILQLSEDNTCGCSGWSKYPDVGKAWYWTPGEASRFMTGAAKKCH
ncbi:hypothetical protein AMELA_G00224220 [Ameiurus melas]|uniref:Uncharacterized protein n=1 Tax=Ameiurus melas TaxID=219545 RepID=A0A7J6A1V5_AMEME|nr:hypothetical protein AMELA_G00224220 [Ameiurus melas]